MRRLLVGLLVLLGVLLPGPAQAQGSAAQGWWTQISGVVPPDVGATDLLLQGADPTRAVPNTGGAIDQSPQPTALAALRFTVVPGSQIGSLVLQFATGGQAQDVRAYPAKGAWVPVQGGALADAAVPDLSRYSAGKLSPDGASLVFPDIGRLATDQGLLSVVLVPGAADRVVVHQPAASALTVVAPPIAAEQAPPPPFAAVPPPSAVVPLLPRADSPALPGIVAPAPAAEEPTVAPAPAPVAAVALPAPLAATRRLVPDDGRSRLIVLLEIALVVGFFGLMGQGPLALLARLTGEQALVEEARGIGRFRTARAGQAPRL
jgi:hypothetical protein